jgi:2-polyprenyl-3-methyl-5-hydroxy-6-metoxy-1,4-benzoquinol methylase
MSTADPSAAPAQTRSHDPARCPFCGGPAEPAFAAVDRNRELSPQRFRYRRCAACATLSLVDVPQDLGRFYPQAYYELPQAGELEQIARGEAHKVALIAGRAPGGRLVEIGPGVGGFAYAARRAGFDVTAIEMDERAAAHLRDRVGVDTVHSDDPATALAGLAPSRAIALWHVIEHLPDPAAVLDAIAANLEPGGVLALATPNPQALQFRLLSARWAHVDAPRHLFLIPLGALTERAAAAGLRRVAAFTSDPSGRHWNLFGWEAALRRRPAAGPPSRALALAAMGVTLAMRPLEQRALRGAAYTALFVKRER